MTTRYDLFVTGWSLWLRMFGLGKGEMGWSFGLNCLTVEHRARDVVDDEVLERWYSGYWMRAR